MPDSEELQKIIFQSVRKVLNIRVSGIVYDVTNSYFFGNKCKLGRLGKSKEGKSGKSLIQVGLGTTEKDGIPVFHKVFKGNVHDSRTFLDMAEGFVFHGVKKGIFVFDRGISSAFIQSLLSRAGWDVVCGIKTNANLKQRTRKLLKNGTHDAIEKIVSCSELRGSVFYVTILENFKIGTVKGNLAICFDPKKDVSRKTSLRREVLEARTLLLNNQDIKEGLAEYFISDGRKLKKLRNLRAFLIFSRPKQN
jgi:transposase